MLYADQKNVGVQLSPYRLVLLPYVYCFVHVILCCLPSFLDTSSYILVLVGVSMGVRQEDFSQKLVLFFLRLPSAELAFLWFARRVQPSGIVCTHGNDGILPSGMT